MYVMLVFDRDDAVKYARAIRAPCLKAARTIAELVSVAYTPTGGYELWSDGVRMLSTYENAPAGAVMSLLPGLRSA